MTKSNSIARTAFKRYLMSDDRHLRHVYSSWSIHKQEAYEYCERLMQKMEGKDLRIIGHNSQAFSAGFVYFDKDTGEMCFAYITKDHTRYTTLDEDASLYREV